MEWDDPQKEDATVYKVLMNHEEQYSIWPDYKEIPSGWKTVDRSGLKAECLAYIKEVWTDMRPLSLRNKMEEVARNPPPPPPPTPNLPLKKNLVDRLCEAEHLVAVRPRPERISKQFKEAIDNDCIHIRFTQANGETELGIRLNRDASNFSGADFENGTGTVHIEGDLPLDYIPVKCTADIDLSRLEGKGHLVKLKQQTSPR